MARYASGWVKLWRKAAEGDLIENPYLWALWHWLLYAAAWKPTSIMWQGKRRDIPAGTVVLGMSQLADKWGCSTNTIKHWLQYLVRSERITIETCTRGTLVTILNWDIYQAKDADDCTPSAHQVHTKCTPSAHYEEGKKEEGNKDKETIKHPKAAGKFDFEPLYKKYPRKRGKSPGLKTCGRIIKTPEDYEKLSQAIDRYATEVIAKGTKPEFQLHFSTFMNQWEDWLELEADPSVIPLVKPAAKIPDDDPQQAEVDRMRREYGLA